MSKKRITKRELKEDRFIVFIRRVNLFLRQRRGLVISWGIIAGLVITLSLIIITTLGRWQRESGKMLGQAHEIFRKAASNEEFREVKERCEEILKRQFAGSKEMALFYKGNCEYRLGEYDEAILSFKRYLDRYPRHFLIPFVREALASTYEQKRDFSLAISAYEDSVKKASDGFKARALLSIGRCQTELNKYKEAKETYQKIITSFPGSAWAEEARLSLAGLKEKD